MRITRVSVQQIEAIASDLTLNFLQSICVHDVYKTLADFNRWIDKIYGI